MTPVGRGLPSRWPDRVQRVRGRSALLQLKMRAYMAREVLRSIRLLEYVRACRDAATAGRMGRGLVGECMGRAPVPGGTLQRVSLEPAAGRTQWDSDNK
jgi:hypothetical protein